MKTRNRLAIACLIIGLFQMLGYLINSPALRGIGAASGIAPFPKVFSESNGYEGFAATFHVTGRRPDGTQWTQRLDPETYARLRGPYNRRNVYGAALAYAPRLPIPWREALFRETLAPVSALREELGIPADLEELRVVITPRPGEAVARYIYPQP